MRAKLRPNYQQNSTIHIPNLESGLLDGAPMRYWLEKDQLPNLIQQTASSVRRQTRGHTGNVLHRIASMGTRGMRIMLEGRRGFGATTGAFESDSGVSHGYQGLISEFKR